MNIIQRELIYFFTFLVMGCLFEASAQEDLINTKSVSAKLKPVEIHYATLTGLCYSIDNELLVRNKDFEDLIFPLRDYETIRLLKRSESSTSTGEIIKIIGLAGVVTGITGLLTSPVEQHTPFWLTAIGGGISFDLGGLFQSEAQTTKFNAIQRYNRFVRGEEQVLPQTPLDEKSLLKFDEPIKTPVPTHDNTPGNKVDHP
jgi:hypothetical protein